MQWVTKDEDKAPPFQEDRGGETLPLNRSSGFLMVAEGKRESEMDS
jgi:hypothetical protein